MKWSGSIFIIFLISLLGCDSDKEVIYPEKANYGIIPQPQKLTTEKGFFVIDENTSINGPEQFHEFLESYTGLKLHWDNPKPGKGFFIGCNSSDIGSETYTLKITKYRVDLDAQSPAGVSRGLATLKQLIMLNSDSSGYFIPYCTIKDSPKFKHRGLLLDCSRHVFEKDVVKKYIDLLAYYKMNTLHWHLTEDQGWRIEIDKYPKLTEIGAWRIEQNGSKYGGFYTKEDIREIVAYAEERHITIIPEIELPGHSQAAIAAYPHLSCTGEQVPVANDWGVFKEIYCAGNDSVFIFLEDVLTEVMELFPSKYIHIGGDEAPKYRWENCPKCQKRIKQEGLKDEHELQSYFISRIEKFLNKNGRQLIGWDEILEGGLSPNATVQSWRGMDGGIEATEKGHYAIMSPTSHCYLDYDLKAIDLEKVYSFDPIPEKLPEDKHHFIMGGEVNMWTEHVPNEDNLDSKIFPRLMALSEVLWNYPKERDYEEFYNRVQYHYPVLESFGVNYGQETVPMTYEVQPAMQGSFVTLKPSNKNIKLNYKKECEGCDEDFKEYKNEKIHIDKTTLLKVQPIKNEQNYGEVIEIPFECHLATNKTVTYTAKYNDWYTAGGDKALVDSKIGTLDFRDGNWQGFWGDDLECVLDFDGIDKGFTSVSANFYQYNNAWIFAPQAMSAEISWDGKDWEDWGSVKCYVDPKQRDKFITTLTIDHKEETSFRYLKLKVKNLGKVPDWHEAAGSDAWIFIDEIIVK